jgi:hypothetical protein
MITVELAKELGFKIYDEQLSETSKEKQIVESMHHLSDKLELEKLFVLKETSSRMILVGKG